MLPRLALHWARQVKRNLRQVMWIAGHQPKAQLLVHHWLDVRKKSPGVWGRPRASAAIVT